ncbi:MAG: tRNA pseudouridine(55) synthase TruB [Spirochaetales bacterium]|nr:tRNA pseudouridine(55) synthase TruB [Spirochaetales bacterium]
MTGGRSGLVLLDKPAEMTSFQALSAIKAALGTRRVGHAGTLDRFATGLLVILTGAYTRLAQLFSGLDKSYRAVVVLGVETDTLDPEGAVVATAPVPGLADVRAVLKSFTGPIEQVPPAYSALHVEGRRAHELSRAGTPPRMAQRSVTIYALDLVRYEPPELEIQVHCSKGTYVRSLARDLAAAAGSRGHLAALRRLAVGPYSVEEAVAPGEFISAGSLVPVREALGRLEGVSCLTVEGQAVRAVRHGNPLEECLPEGYQRSASETLAVFDREGDLLAVARGDRGRYRYLAVFREAEA